ncbi:glycosyltransferase family 9 protein [candidate division TA06 bacterium]|nr:glycosyltransferase family 9 protein [candidate division TA06 bacterium]
MAIPNCRISKGFHIDVDDFEKRFEEIFQGNPFLDELIVFDRESFQKLSLFRRIIEELKFIHEVRRRRFDLAIDLQGTLRSALLSFLSKTRHRVGYTYRFRKTFYNIRVIGRNPQYAVEYNLDTLRALGLSVEEKDLVFSLPEDARRFGREFLKSHSLRTPELRGNRVVGLFPGGGWSAKRWSVEKYAELGERIEKELGFEVLLLGGPQEKGVLSEISSRMANQPWILEDVSLKKFGGVLEKLDLLVGNDSSPTHIAIALGVPTITFFGPTDAQSATPPGGRHIAISRNEYCRKPNTLTCDLPDCCIQSIEVEEVMEKVKEVLESNSGH